MKQTPFNEIHRKLGAKLVEFAGFEMPIQYSGIVNEHKRVRESVGVFDVSHMGEFFVHGKDVEAFLQQNTLNDITKLTPGRAQYTALINEDGFLLDDLIVYRLDSAYMIVANASNIKKDFAAFSSRKTGDVKLEDASDATALLSVQGPDSKATLDKIVDVDLSSIKYYHFLEGKVAGIDAIISRTGYTGEVGFEIFFGSKVEDCTEMWDAIFDAGKEFGILPIGLGARDTLRLEMGYCLYGNDIDETTNPIEAGLGWITKIDKGDFFGRDAVVKAKQNVTRKLVGFRMDQNAIPRHGYGIHSSADGGKAGVVTSGTFSPSLEAGIGLGYVETSLATENQEVFVDIRGKRSQAHVVKLPFVSKKN